MRFSYEIYEEKQAIVLRLEGVFTLAQLRAGVELLWSDARYDRSYIGIIDLTDSGVGVDLVEFRALLKFLEASERTTQGRWAAVITSPLAAACALLYRQTIAHRHSLEVFSTWDAACRFLHLDIPPRADLPCVLV